MHISTREVQACVTLLVDQKVGKVNLQLKKKAWDPEMRVLEGVGNKISIWFHHVAVDIIWLILTLTKLVDKRKESWCVKIKPLRTAFNGLDEYITLESAGFFFGIIPFQTPV